MIQNLYSEKICIRIFTDSMGRFINNESNNFIQFYFEEAHNLFPKKEDKDLSQIYNRIAKEGAKLNLGMIYATQEVSSISSNILKNTQNWFIAHLNNDDEIKELRKYYDFSDFADSLIRFSAKNDKGFVRMKTYSNPFVVPVQIDRFLANR
jgi:DNA helicase HerA-like ATPase